MAKRVMDELIAKGRVTRGFLALVPQDIDENLVKALKLKGTAGALVAEVTPGGPADHAGIKRGDVILEYDGKPVEGSVQLRMLVAETRPGTAVKMTLFRDGSERTVTVTVGERPQPVARRSPRQEREEGQAAGKLGLSIQTLTPELAEELGYSKDRGVLVAGVAAGSPAEDAGIERGDLIKEVNRIPTATEGEFVQLVSRLRSGDMAALLVRRGQSTFYVAVSIP